VLKRARLAGGELGAGAGNASAAAAAALGAWTRAAAQANVDALVKLGDYHFHALGTPTLPRALRDERAAGFYRAAADTQLSALAMFNLGWMYENGRGVPRDFHLAKRYFDMALESSADAYLPVVLSLAKLYVRSAWHKLNGGTDGLRLWPGDEDSARLSFSLPSCSVLTRAAEDVYEGKGRPPRARALEATADGAAPAQPRLKPAPTNAKKRTRRPKTSATTGSGTAAGTLRKPQLEPSPTKR
jgi:TPR repeat protein